MKKINPCKICGSIDKHKNRGCRPCQNAKQTIRNEDGRSDCHIEDELRGKKNNELKKQARLRGDVYFESETPCFRCGNKRRYVCNHACNDCS